ncbi:hypothetical protein DC083_00740 [Ignatzschineria ureiclastica]|uniref:SPOR domain-containing protein n=1 Tax=Ignatzschineria ureiclastica TaxID=472582 RepID=A0A2U2AGH3_9GAMM|nr:SPOR domain-containing protein [Ignatzschineria ureiclastica]PWD81755.1 hypothetical protein DC083_00740 [Ignatzschineria ureiclastica]GGZ90298.1 sporulation protein [Ignatzschineria ureiclastica]
MSKTTSNSITQRIVGAVVLLALIALIAVLLFQPSDKLPSTASKGQRPTTTAPEATIRPGSNQAPPIIVLESTPGNQGTIAQGTISQGNNVTLPNITAPETNAPSVEVVDEAIWQQVEQATAQVKPPAPANNRPIAQGFNASTQATAPAALTHNNTAQQKPSSKPNNGAATANTAKKPEPTPPKLELVSSSQASQNRAPAATQNSKAPAQTATKSAAKPATQGGWYVQLGAFGKAENAQKTYNQYKQLGYNVRIQKENNIHRVQVGPYASKEAAEQIKTRTRNSKEGINPSVIRIP